MLKETLEGLRFVPTKADPDVYRRPQTKPDGTKYYEYILVYVDDILCISHNTKPPMAALGELYRLKEESVGIPD